MNHSKGVIPAKAGIQENTGFPRIKYGVGLVKPGMTTYKDLVVIYKQGLDDRE